MPLTDEHYPVTALGFPEGSGWGSPKICHADSQNWPCETVRQQEHLVHEDDG